MHEPIPPEIDEDGRETHPAFGMIGAYRVTSTPGAVLFDSDLTHHHSVVLRISTAERHRDLNRDWMHSKKEFVEVQMSEAQWAAFVSSMNTSGVPCTIRRREDDYDIPGLPYEPRLGASIAEVREAADQAVAKIKESHDALVAAFEGGAGKKEMRERIRDLSIKIQHMPANTQFAAKSLNEHVENVVQKARMDLEAMVVNKAHQLGIEPGEVADTHQLLQGD